MHNFKILVVVSFIYFNWSDGNPCIGKKWIIKLFINNDEEHQQLNKYLENNLTKFPMYSDSYSYMYDDHSIIIMQKCDTRKFITVDPDTKDEKLNLTLTFDAIRINPDLCKEDYYSPFSIPYALNEQIVVVYLRSMDIGQYNYNYILDNDYIVADDGITPMTKCNEEGLKHYQELCKLNATQTECDNQTWIRENCDLTEKQFSLRHTLVSKNILEFPSLYDYIANFPSIDNNVILCKPKTRSKVIICGRYLDYNVSFNNWLEVKFVQNCKSVKTDSRTIAVLAPSPYDISDNIYITTIFLEQFATTDAIDSFINSFPAILPRKATIAIKSFLKMNKCKRIAIISDDSTTSQEYEQQYTQFFKEENMIYISRTCDFSDCSDFSELLHHISKAQPTLILINIAEEYVEELTNQIKYSNKRPKYWIFPSWSESAIKKVANLNIGDVFSITMSVASNPKYFRYDVTLPRNVLENHSDKNTLGALIYDCKLHNYYNLKVEHRNIAKRLKLCLQSTKIMATIHKSYPMARAKIAEITILDNDTIDDYNELQMAYIHTDVNDCTFVSQSYMQVCEDENVMYIWLVVSVFILMTVVILYFVQSTKVSYSRMNK